MRFRSGFLGPFFGVAFFAGFLTVFLGVAPALFFAVVFFEVLFRAEFFLAGPLGLLADALPTGFPVRLSNLPLSPLFTKIYPAYCLL